MTPPPVICFGQQPCGFFPRRFLVAKWRTARRLQAEIGGEIVFFCHDSDHDARETQTLLRHRRTGAPARLNFAFVNPVQRRWSPLYLKRIAPDWAAQTLRQLPAYVEPPAVAAFKASAAETATVADFCLGMYGRMGLLDGIRVVRSSDPAFRRAACAVGDYFVEVSHEGEIVRARWREGGLFLHEGGDAWVALPPAEYGPEQISPARDTRLRWMQSVVHCTHYVAGAGEQAYLRREDAPEITFVPRDAIDQSDEAFTQIPASAQA
jgi:hypothetical protein